jgi:hypothetical protein
LTVEAPNKAVAQMMVLAQLRRNFATAPLADRADMFVVCREGEKADERSGARQRLGFLIKLLEPCRPPDSGLPGFILHGIAERRAPNLWQRLTIIATPNDGWRLVRDCDLV